MKKLFSTLFLIFFALFYSQNFDFIRTWGTYIGPVSTELRAQYQVKPLMFVNNNIIVNGNVMNNNNFSASYYNQFVSSNSQSFNSAYPINNYKVTISPSGSFLDRVYKGSISPMNTEDIILYDSTGNYYVSKSTSNAYPNFPTTPNVWLPTNITPGSSTITNTLSKYSSSGNLLWTTYIPSDYFFIQLDSQDNVYVLGNTLLQNNIATSGTSNPDFLVRYDPSNQLMKNGYLVKLNSQGQRLWGTYIYSGVDDLQLYNDDIYLRGGAALPNTTIATSNTFQQAEARTSLQKFNSQNGTQVWGTYFGAPNNQSFHLLFSMKVNESGIFLNGTAYNMLNSNYYTTPGSFKEVMTGSTDLFLTKFNHNGNRIWGTFFGGDGDEGSNDMNTMDVFGTEIIITGNQYGGENLATPYAYKTEKSTAITNLFFTKFDTNGNRLWTSYYGDANRFNGYETEFINVKIKDNNTFYLFGNTNALTGFSTQGAAQPNIISPNMNIAEAIGFVARFDKKGEMNTSETVATQDFVLHNNPNHGNFYLSGSLLQKQNSRLKIYDASGRLVHQQPLSKNAKQFITLEHLLTKGNYMVEVLSDTKTSLKTFKMIVE